MPTATATATRTGGSREVFTIETTDVTV